MKTSYLIGALVLFTALAASSRAYATYAVCCGSDTTANRVRWASDSVALKRLPNSFPSGGAATLRLEEVAARYADVIDSKVSVSVSADSNNTYAWGNGVSEVYWVTKAPDNFVWAINKVDFEDVPGCAANGQVNQYCCFANPCSAPKMVEVDIEFYLTRNDNSSIDWNLNEPSPFTSASGSGAIAFPAYFSVVASHELGHAVGLLLHDPFGTSRMESVYPNGGWFHDTASTGFRVRPLGIDSSHLGILYPDTTSGWDAYAANVQHNHQAGSDPANHNKPLSWGAFGGSYTDGAYPRRVPVLAGQALNKAHTGDTVTAVLQLGNLGNAAVSTPEVKVYLSSNTTLDANDALVFTGNCGNLPAYTPILCSGLQFTVPNVANGAYYVLYKVGPGSGNDVGIVNRPLVVF